MAQTGHRIQDCAGPNSVKRWSFHSWVKGSINDVLIPIESYQTLLAGGTEPIRILGKKVIDRGGYVKEPKSYHTGEQCSSLVDLDIHATIGRYQPPLVSDVPMIAQETMDAYETDWKLQSAKVLGKYKPMMRFDIIVPDSEEA
ncbi:APO domain, partial [Dillenia turbinata]